MKPDRSQLLHLKNDAVFQWLMNQLLQQFRPPKPSYCHKTIQDQHRIAGEQQVMESIAKLLGDED